MAITDEQYHEIGFELVKVRLLREMSIYELSRMTENDVKKRIGQMAQEASIPREFVLEFAKRLILEIELIVKESSDMLENITFK